MEVGKSFYQKEVNRMTFEKKEINKMMKELEQKINRAVLKKVLKIRKANLGCKRQNRECTEKKRDMKKALRKWKQGKDEKEVYIQRKWEYKRLCKEKEAIRKNRRGNRANKEYKSIMEIYKQGKEKRNNKQLHEWKNYFMELLEGMEYTKQAKEEEREISMQVEEK